ncbi:MAG TPA: circadian clock KaiB family protein [Xanthomonadales bacterium]|nr:circadian clock KaiB family protein [Xanthomonadales bacterium]
MEGCTASAGAGTCYVLKLYVTGMGMRSQRAIERIRAVCRDHLEGRCELEIVDLYERPDAAAPAQVVAAPTLVREAPPPVRRLVGDLSDHARVLFQLDLGPRPAERVR